MSEDESADQGLIVTLTCPDRTGIVHSVAGVLATHGWNIDDSQQYADHTTGRFFMRVEASGPGGSVELQEELRVLGAAFEMELGLYDRDEVPAVLILVSQFGHCLNDLLYRQSTGALRCRVVGVVSNHPDFAPLTASYGIEFHHLPVSSANRDEQEQAILDLAGSLGVSLVVLARYMQILSPKLVECLEGRAINIHHSFLPSFKGARPYHQAYERGVKLIGATAHYVTSELDEGQIIEQEVTRVDHRLSPAQLSRIGEDLECIALARAVSWHLSHRVMRNGKRTVVFA